MNAAAARSFDDRLNPILVKEVRQALRGRYFRALFWLTLGVATLVGLSIVANDRSSSGGRVLGREFFMVMFACLSAAVHAFTPFSAFLSTSAEWDENTHDLLVLSNLRPRQIVYGKLCSALVQALLYYSTFGPFLVFAFLTSGVDLAALGAILFVSMACCASLTLLGIALASLSAAKAPRVVLMALFGIGLVLFWGASLGMASGVVYSPQMLRDPQALVLLVGIVVAILLAGAFFAAIAVARLSHEEENRSSGLRVLSVAIVASGLGFGAWMGVGHAEPDFAWGLQVTALFPLAVAWLFFLTEPEPLGRHVRLHVSRNPLLAALSAPFLPGGGRGALLLMLHMLLAVLGALLCMAFSPMDPARRTQAFFGLLGLYAYAWIYMGIPAGAASFFVSSLRGRVVVRMGIVFLLPVVLLGPPLLGLLLGLSDLRDGLHPFNPASALSALIGYGETAKLLELALATFALLSLLLNAPRMIQGVREVLSASAERRVKPIERS